MKQENGYRDPLSRLIKYHEDVSEYLEIIGEALGFLFDEQAWIKIEQIKDFFERNVIEHFKFEERKRGQATFFRNS